MESEEWKVRVWYCLGGDKGESIKVAKEREGLISCAEREKERG